MCTTRSWVQILSSHNVSVMILSMHDVSVIMTACQFGKQHRHPFLKERNVSKGILDVVHQKREMLGHL